MADSVTSQKIIDNDRYAIFAFTNVSDGTGESAVLKVDVSALNPDSLHGATCTGVVLRKAQYNCDGMSVSLLWDATTDVRFLILSGFGCQDFEQFSGIPNNAGAGVTGDILFTTNGAAAGDTYSIILTLIKKYD